MEQFALGFYYNNSCPLAFQSAIGDEFCQDELNHPYCNYDDGDCCQPLVYSNACTECTCLDSDDPITFEMKPLQKIPCPDNLTQLINDKHCHDEANIPQCGYDGGDCCGTIDFIFCSECLCLNPSQSNQRRGKHSVINYNIINYKWNIVCFSHSKL